MFKENINIISICSNQDWIIFSGSIIFTLIAIFHGNKLKNKSSQNQIVEHMVMGRQLTLPLFIATLVSSWYGGIIGVTQIAFEHGIFNFITQGLFWYISYFIFAIFVAKKINQSQALSLPDLIEKLFGKKSAAIAAILIFFKTIPISMAISIGIFLQLILPFDLTTCIIIGVCFVALYTFFGGLRAVVFSDSVQFILMYIGVASVIVFSYANFGGLTYLQQNLPESHFKLTANYSISQTLVWFFIAVSTTFVNPTFYQRCFAAKTPTVASKGILISILIWFLFDMCTTLGGMYARAAIPEASPTNGYLIYAMQILPDGFRGLLLASMLATICSTLDSFLFLASNILFYDLKIIKFKSFHLKHLFALLAATVITILLSMFFKGKIEIAWKTFKSYFASSLIMPFLVGGLIKKYINDKNLNDLAVNLNLDKVFFITCITCIISVSLWDILKLESYLYLESFYIGNIIGILSMLILFKLQTKN